MMKLSILLSFCITSVLTSLNVNAQCSLYVGGQSTSICSGTTLLLIADCENLDSPEFNWQVRKVPGSFVFNGSNPDLNYTFSQAGDYIVNCRVTSGNYVKELEETITVTDGPSRPHINSDGTTICAGGSAKLSIASPQPGVVYRWRSTPVGFTAEGISAVFDNVLVTTKFEVIAENGTQCSEYSSESVYVIQSGTLSILPTDEYHKELLTANIGGYLQTSPSGTDKSLRVSSSTPLWVSKPGTYFLRQYASQTDCWATASGGFDVALNYSPPLPFTQQSISPGSNAVFITNSEKEFIFTYADYFWVSGEGSVTILRTFNDGGTIQTEGTYYLRGKDRETGTWGPTATIRVKLLGDDGLNWVHTKSFDGTSSTVPVAESKSYYDESGRLLQTQSKVHTDAEGNFVFTAGILRDRYDRDVGATLPAPIASKEFKYTSAFALNPEGKIFSKDDFDTESTLLDSKPVSDEFFGTVGWYYSDNNTLEENVPTTPYPYSRTEFYEDGSGEVKRSASPGIVMKLGSGHEILSGSFPVVNELDNYLAKRRLTGLSDNQSDNTLKYEGAQSVVRDQNGKYAISMSDKNGQSVMSARSGTKDDYSLMCNNIINTSLEVGAPNYADQTLFYFYILQEQEIVVTGSDYVIEDMVTEKPYIPLRDNDNDGVKEWVPGFYRIVLNSGLLQFSYINYYKDVSYQFYDDAGRVKFSVSPNGFEQWKSNDFSEIDKSSYRYNHQGWLLSMTETDAGTTTYAYRKDGSIRFSQNAKQLHERTFSYTNYDQLGRPVESGQLPLATGEEFNDLKSTAALAGIGDAFSSARTRTDWIKTYYDLPDETNSGFVQNFVRGGVSWSENENAMTWYSYDELGRVVSTKQFIKGPKIATTNTYKYDFLGNVLTMNASPTIGASITYTYQYDRERRLKSVNVKTDKIDKLIARYEYYLHGPLKRIELGEKLQGIDYVYNIHGWLTQINHPNVSEDPGADGAAGDHAEFKEDVFGLALNYYESTIQNLYAKVAAPSDELLKRHHFPAGFMAYTKPSTVSSVAGAENWFTPAQNEHGRANMGTLQAPSLQNLSTK